MSLFKPAENTMAFFKAGFMGDPGAGKTHTATLVAIGLTQLLRERKIAGADRPVMLLDTEQGSSWVLPMFREAGIELLVAKTRAFKDLVPALREAERNASVLFVDSITHFWEELQASYMSRLSDKRGRKITRLEFQDWAYIKSEWRTFSDAFVTSNLHCILSGRLGWEYEQYEDDRGRKQIERSGAKMQAEKGLGYEPNILVWMERSMDLHTKTVARTATVLKDRSRRLDGKQFPDPTFETFLPHIEFMALGGRHEAVDTARTSEDIMPDGDAPPPDLKGVQRKIVLDEIQALMLKRYPGRTAKEQKGKGELLVKYFDTTSWTEVEQMLPLVDLQAAYNNMHLDLEKKPSRYGIQEPTRGGFGPQKNNVDRIETSPIDEIPYQDAPPAAEPEAAPLAAEDEPQAAPPDDLDIDTIIRDFEAEIAKAKNASARRQLWDATSDYREVMSAEQLEKIRKVYARSLMGGPAKASQKPMSPMDEFGIREAAE